MLEWFLNWLEICFVVSWVSMRLFTYRFRVKTFISESMHFRRPVSSSINCKIYFPLLYRRLNGVLVHFWYYHVLHSFEGDWLKATSTAMSGVHIDNLSMYMIAFRNSESLFIDDFCIYFEYRRQSTCLFISSAVVTLTRFKSSLLRYITGSSLHNLFHAL